MNLQLNTASSLANNSGSSKASQRFSQLERLKAEKGRNSFRDFVVQAWPILEPGSPFIPGIHTDAICQHLQAVAEGRIRNLIINIPPGHAKSMLVGVFFAAWIWIRQPETRFLYSSYREDLAIRDSVKCRRLIESEWYQQRWGDCFQMAGDQNQKQRFETDRTGYRVVVPIGGGTGERGDYVIVDDPHTVEQAESDLQRTNTVDWWNGTMSTRLNHPSQGHKIVVQQRLHELDLTGDLLARGGYEHLCLPAEFDPDRRCETSIWKDPRTHRGELLSPERMGRAALDEARATLGSYRYEGQYQQRPSPAGGEIFKRHWWKFWKLPGMNLPDIPVKLPDGTIHMCTPVDLPQRFDQEIQSWDLAFKGTSSSDFVVGQVLAALGADRYVLDQIRDRLDFPGTQQAFRVLSARRPQAQTKLVEGAANGPAIIQSLRREIGGLIEVNPEGGKISRAHAASALLESGNWYLPHPKLAGWVEGFIAEFAAFPYGAHDDQVDAWSQGSQRLQGIRPTPAAPRPFLPRVSRGSRDWMV